MTKRLLVLLTVIGMVAASLSGGYAFLRQYMRHQEWKRRSAEAEEKISGNKLDEALVLLRRIEAEGGTPRATWQLGYVLWDMGQKQTALDTFARLEKRWPQNEYSADVLLMRARYTDETLKDENTAKELYLQICERFPKSTQVEYALVALARRDWLAGNTAQARQNLERVIRNEASPSRVDAEVLLGEMNVTSLLSPNPQPGDETYVIQRGDVLGRLQSKLKVPIEVLVGINNLNPNALTVGRVIKVPRLKISVVIDKQERTLTLKNNGQFLSKYRVGILRDDQKMPVGEYKVTEKTDKGMDYPDTVNGTVIHAGVADNPYGPRVFISLKKGIAIHGCADPGVLGKYTDRGYVSMDNAQAEQVYRLVQVGTVVTIKGRVQAIEVKRPN